MVALSRSYTEKLHLMTKEEEQKITMTEQNNYGSVQFYADLFADILADVQSDNPVYGDNIIAGFKTALREWRQYHKEQVMEYQRIEQKANDEI